MAQTKHWKRWTQTSHTKFFPKSKYNFTEILKRVGDYVVTFPMTQKEYLRIKDAAKYWAWYHDKRVSIVKIPASPDTWRVRVTLIAHHREL